MNKSSERSTGEIIAFATTALGIYMVVWGVILVNKWIVGSGVGLALCSLLVFAMRDSD